MVILCHTRLPGCEFVWECAGTWIQRYTLYFTIFGNNNDDCDWDDDENNNNNNNTDYNNTSHDDNNQHDNIERR